MNPYAAIQPFDHNAVAQRYEMGRQRAVERNTRNALMQYMTAEMGGNGLVGGDNPLMDKALMDVARNNPQIGMQLMQRRKQQQEATRQQQLEIVGRAAQYADTPEKWDMIVDQLEAEGIAGAAKYKGRFSPELRAAVMAQAGVSDAKPAQDPGIIREFQIAIDRGLVQPGTSFQQYLTMRNPGMMSPVVIPENATVEMPGQPQMPRVSTPQEAMSLPPGTQFVMPDGRIGTVPGGASGNAGGGFPGR